MKQKRPSKTKIKYSPWEKWDSGLYLKTYFPYVRKDEDETLKFLVHGLKKWHVQNKHKNPTALEFGAGPMVVHALAIAPYVSSVHLADYLQSNLDEIRKWLNNQKAAFDWSPFVHRILELEGQEPTPARIRQRTGLLRKKAKKILRCDASLAFPLNNGKQRYPLVTMLFCADSATSSIETWRAYMKNILNLVEPSGTILLAALHNCSFYKLGRNFFPCANITKRDLYDILLESGFRRSEIAIDIKKVPECKAEGYSSLVFARATKSKF